MSDDGQEFYNPYNFVPLRKSIDINARSKEWSSITAAETTTRHDAWLNRFADIFSGKINCTLRLDSPTLVGNQQKSEKDQPTVMLPYQRLINGKHCPAFPGNSLRGMVGVVMETISQSNMRVMTSENQSVRADLGNSLSSIGEIVEKDGALFIRALKVPTLTSSTGDFKIATNWIKAFGKDETWGHILGAYHVKYESHGDAIDSKDKLPNNIRVDQKLASLNIAQPLKLTDFEGFVHCKFLKVGKAGYLLSQKPNSKSGVNLKVQPYELGREPNNLENGGPRENMPNSKIKEWLVPYEKEHILKRPLLPLPNKVIDDWYILAQERILEDGDLPLLPTSNSGSHTIDKDNPKNNKVRRPQAGDLIYFDIDNPADNGVLPSVIKISYSANWRERVPSVRDFLSDFSPWDSSRTKLTPAEMILGAVEEDGKGSFASRVKFTDALADKFEYLNDEANFLLDELASPKAPSPAMYFKPAGIGHQGLVQKSDLLNSPLDSNEPNGFKRYIPHQNVKVGIGFNFAEATQANKRQLITKLLAPSQNGCNEFHFTVHCENLSTEEMSLLLTALDPTDDQQSENRFIHRLGIGKPLGLGMVTVTIDQILKTPIAKNYSLNDWTVNDEEECERSAWKSQAIIEGVSLNYLRSLGSKNSFKTEAPVMYPRMSDSDDNYYEWFVKNDSLKKEGQYLSTSSTTGVFDPLSTYKKQLK